MGAILLQTLLTLNHIKFFPLSDHGIFENPHKLKGQNIYRFITKESAPHYHEETILYHNHQRLKFLLDFLNIPPAQAPQYFRKDIVAIDRFQMANTNEGPLFTKQRIWEQ